MTPIPVAAGVVAVDNAAAPPARPGRAVGAVFAALLAPLVLCSIGMQTPILTADMLQGAVKQQVYFFKTCTDADLGIFGKTSTCGAGNPGGKGATAMFFALGFSVIHGINILTQMCTYRKKCCFLTTCIGSVLLFFSFIFVALFKNDLVGYEFGGGFFALIVGWLLSVGTVRFLQTKG
jgi:hypothetical protein